MAKDAKKKSPDPKKEPKAPSDRHPIRSFLKAAATLTFVGLCVFAYLRTRDHVDKSVTFRRDPPRVVLKDQPAWMSDARARRIMAVAKPDVSHSAFDHNLLVNTASLLRNHPDTAPWVREVRSVRRVFGQGPGDVLEIDCDFRSPIALVKWENYYWLIDADGVLLPEQYTASDVRKVMYDKSGQICLRILEGVATAPPESGRKWQGSDLAAGIDLAKLLYGKTYTNEVERIDITNFAGRKDPREAQLVCITRFNTEVRWGRPVFAKDYFVEVSPAQKLQYMEKIVQQFGRVDARHSAVDLRFDRVTYPAAEAPGMEANSNLAQ